MQGLKALVIFLGVLIVLGLGVLVYGIATKAGKLGDAPAEEIGATAVAIPAGARVVEMRPDGERLYLRLATDEGERILILDSSGRHLGTIDLEAGAPEVDE